MMYAMENKLSTFSFKTDTQIFSFFCKRHPLRLFEDVWRFMLTLNGVCSCVPVSAGVSYCLMLSGDLRRVPEEFLKGYLSGVYGRV